MNHCFSLERRRGSVLLLTFVISMALIVLLAAATTTALNQGKEANYKLDRTRAIALAEGVTETAKRRMLEQVTSFQAIQLAGTVILEQKQYNYVITPIGKPFGAADADGVTSQNTSYRISVRVDVRDATANVDRVVKVVSTPIFQYMIFYDGDLELLPGPSMTLGGRVHANGDIYVGSGRTLTVDTEYFRGTGSIYRQRKDRNVNTAGRVQIKVAGEPTYAELKSPFDSRHPDWTTYAQKTWKGTVQDGTHGVSEVAVPSIGGIKAFNPDGTKGYYHSQAGLVIVDGNVYRPDGVVVPLPPGTVTEKKMYDGREKKYVVVTEVDVGLLNTSGHFPPNGLIYAYRTDASVSMPNGFRLTNGAKLAAPLTVVSEDPVYVHGDFNTLEKKGAAVIADAVNLLSNAWDDSKGPGKLPAAANTTYNLAFITGDTPTPEGGGNYSGGFENLPRFHENWSRKTATIRGSFVKNYESEVAAGLWKYGSDVYRAPVRDWSFDVDLTDPSKLPPFTPSAVAIQQVVWDDGKSLPF